MTSVLVVEDERSIRQLLAASLQRAGIEVETAVDGQEALERIDRGTSYRLVILDLMMPRMDGLGFLAELQTRPAPHPLVIVMTAAGESVPLPASVHLVVPKPFDLATLTAIAFTPITDLVTK